MQPWWMARSRGGGVASGPDFQLPSPRASPLHTFFGCVHCTLAEWSMCHRPPDQATPRLHCGEVTLAHVGLRLRCCFMKHFPTVSWSALQSLDVSTLLASQTDGEASFPVCFRSLRSKECEPSHNVASLHNGLTNATYMQVSRGIRNGQSTLETATSVSGIRNGQTWNPRGIHGIHVNAPP